MSYVVVVRDRWCPDAISFVWHGGETLEDAQRRRGILEARLTELGGSSPKPQMSIWKIAERIPAWERP